MLKILLALSAALYIDLAFSQENNANLIGSYQDHFGSSIIINKDSTFKYRWNFDLASSWSNGKWAIKNDTVYFKTVLVYDTLRINSKDNLVLAEDEKPKRIFGVTYISAQLTSGGQNRMPCPAKLLFRGGELLMLTNSGKIDLNRRKVFSDLYFPPSYYRKTVN